MRDVRWCSLTGLLAIVLFAVALISCGGDGGGDSSNTAPVADAGADQAVSVGRSVTLDGSGSSDAEGPITYAWSFDTRPAGSSAALHYPWAVYPFFTPDVRGIYELSLIVSDGELSSAPDSVTITARAWEGTEEIDAGDYDAYHPQVAVDAGGNAFAVWYQDDGTYYSYSIYANRYDAASGAWEEAETIETGDPAADSPQVAVDAGGNAFAVWTQYDWTKAVNIYANRYDANSGTWEGAVPIETGDGLTYSPQVAVDAGGNAFAVWYQDDGAYYSIYANRYDAESGTWQGAVVIELGDYDAYDPQVAFDAGGNAFAVWAQGEGFYRDHIYANRYDANSGTWEGAVPIETGDGLAHSPQVAFDAGGNAFAVWYQDDGTYYSIYANRYDAASGAWEEAETIETGDPAADSPQVAVDAGGNAFAVWTQYDWTKAVNIYANRYDANSGTWEGAVPIETGDGLTYSPQVAVDADGNAFAVWLQSDGTYLSIYARRYE